MKRSWPWNGAVDVISSDDSSSSDDEIEVYGRVDHKKSSINGPVSISAKEMTSQDMVIKRAEMYQEYMKRIPVPVQCDSVIPFTSWTGLGKSIKQLYGQPLHYLTNVRLRQWDQQRIGSEDENTSLDVMIHPCKAEATIWLLEELNRLTASHHHLAKLWQSDPMYPAFLDSIAPQL
ncbi:hypothetical protein Tsubulata_048819 [Turnera subulata]|uniref:Protein RDM1 n=1 Tax=Turnera subulata TaxID=218843 RepID=A0A9Q0JD36_9ROSI|nr:hypothetical protein Tsubulata_048819 [Turnera subulata]